MEYLNYLNKHVTQNNFGYSRDKKKKKFFSKVLWRHINIYLTKTIQSSVIEESIEHSDWSVNHILFDNNTSKHTYRPTYTIVWPCCLCIIRVFRECACDKHGRSSRSRLASFTKKHARASHSPSNTHTQTHPHMQRLLLRWCSCICECILRDEQSRITETKTKNKINK